MDADPSEISAFVRATFTHADEGTFASLRTFGHSAGDPPIDVTTVKLDGNGLAELVRVASGRASRAARHPQPTVFCPPICTLSSPTRAREEDLANGLALSVEIDANAEAGLALLRGLIGRPTVVVASGGTWADPASGEVQSKLHGHWRLSEPTRDPPDHARLKQARRLATALVGGDATNIPVVHPIRWPGSVHRKGEPKLCYSVELNEDAEIDLDDALDALETAAAARGIGLTGTAHGGGHGEHRETAALIAEIMAGAAYVAPLTALSARYAGGGMTKAKIVETLEGLMQAVPLEVRDGGQRGRWQSRYDGIPRMAASAIRKFGPKAEQTDKRAAAEEQPPEHMEERPLIRLRGGGLAEHTADAAKALARETARAPMTGIYARGSMLVRPVRLQSVLEVGGIRRAAGMLQLLAADRDFLRTELTRVCAFEKYDKRAKMWLEADAPEELAKSVLAAVPWPTMPPLTGIIEAPTLRLDGTLLDRPGYDPETGLLLDPGGTRFDPIPARPTRKDAMAALGMLHKALAGFPFAADEGGGSATVARSVAISAQITALVRRLLRAAPLFAYSAPKMASGKTLLATLVSYLATGRAPAMLTPTDDEESERKRLFAVLLEGAPVAVLDNIEGELASSALCSILTEPLFSDRLLGVSRNPAVPTNVTFLTTGNNIAIKGDLSTRTLVCALDPQCERPEERKFDVNLHEAVPRRRGELVAAALTIPLAFLAAGAPGQGLAPFGRFEDWSRWCRDPLVWLGEPDPCASRKRIEDRDPVRGQLGALLAAWRDVFGESAQTVAFATTLEAGSEAATRLGADSEAIKALREAIQAIAQYGRETDPRRLGNFISRHEDRREGGLRFVRMGKKSHAVRWKAAA